MKSTEQQIVKKSVFLKLVNTERNQELLEQAISKEFLDLSAVVRIIIKKNEKGMLTKVLTKKEAEEIGMSEEEIYLFALQNTVRIFPKKIIKLGSFIEKILGGLFLPEEEDIEAYILTNEQEVDGAVYLMSSEVMEGISKVLGDNLYILPSSVNEVIIVKESDLEEGIDGLKELVREVNKTLVAEKDILSDHVYHYNKKDGITIAA